MNDDTEHPAADPRTAAGVVDPESERRAQAARDLAAALESGDVAAARQHLDVVHPPDAAANADPLAAASAAYRAAPSRKHADTLRQALDAQAAATAAAARFRPSGATKAPPPIPWCVPDWIPDRALTLLAGTGEIGKSTLAVALTCAVAGGRGDWIAGGPPLAADFAAGGAPVLLASYEDAREHLERLQVRLADKLQDANARPWAARDHLGDRWHVADLTGGEPLWAVDQRSNVGAATPMLDRLRTYAGDVGARLVVVDSAASAYAGNENDRANVRPFLAALADLARTLPAAVVLIQHPPKPPVFGARTHAYSGSTDWRNMPRAVLALEVADVDADGRDADARKAQASLWRLRREKGNYAEAPPPVYLKRWKGARLWPRFEAQSFEAAFETARRGSADAASADGNGQVDGAAPTYTAADLGMPE